MNAHHRTPHAVIPGVILAAIAASATGAFAQDKYWVTNGGYNGTFNDGSASSHWSNTLAGAGGATAPGTTEYVNFDNSQISPYTVNFNANIQTSVFSVPTDNITFNLSGYTWTSRLAGFGDPPFNYYDGAKIGVGAGVTGAVKVSSSAAGGLIKNFLGTEESYYALSIGGGGGSGTLIIDDSLGFGATLYHKGNVFLGGGANTGSPGIMTVSGAGSVFRSTYGGEIDIGGASVLTVTNSGLFDSAQPFNVGVGPNAAVNVNNGGTINTGFTTFGFYAASSANVNTGGTWNAGNVQIGQYQFYTAAPMEFVLTVDGATSSFNANNFTVGTTISGYTGNGDVNVQNGGTLKLAGNLLLNPITVTGEIKNRVTLNAGNVLIAGGANVTNNGGVLRGAGAISRSSGVTAFNVVNNTDGELRPGDTSATPAIGTISITNANLTQNAGGTTFFDFAAGGLGDKILTSGGTANIDGAVTFNLIGATPDWTVSQGWIFLTADTINYTATDNMLSLLSGYGVTPYFYGIGSYGSQQALVLLIPEPSTMTIVLACGALVGIRRGKRGAMR